MVVPLLALLSYAFAAQHPQGVYYTVPVGELEFAAGQVLPSYAGSAPWEQWNAGVESLPWAALEGEGEVVLQIDHPMDAFADDGELRHPLGQLFVSTSAARALAGTLYLPKATGAGFLRLAFRVPEGRATASEKDFRVAELQYALGLMRMRLPGGAWFRHRYDELRAALGPDAPLAPDPEAWFPRSDFREPSDALDLFSGGRALYENLQLERRLPGSAGGDATVALDSIEGVTVRALDWKPLLAPGETQLDSLAALIPADQHALFFPSFPAFVAVLDEADRLGTFGLAAFEARSSDARTRARYERQLGLELSAFARTFGPLVVESVALTGSDPYLRSGSDVALLLRARDTGNAGDAAAAEVVRAFVAARQEAAPGEEVGGTIAGLQYRGVVDPTRSVSSYLAVVGGTVVVTNSLIQLERVARAAAGGAATLAASDEYRFFRQRYVLGAVDESALLVLSDAAIRRWCSPRWRIASARIARAAAELAEEHAAHFPELVAATELVPGTGLAADVAERELGVAPGFPDLGALSLSKAGVRSPVYGTLDFLTPIAELPFERVSEREAALYRTWREGYQQAWSNFFDPIGARLSVTAEETTLDLTVMPLILGTEYADLRAVAGETPLEPGSGDPHPEALVHFVLSLDPESERLKSIGSILGSAGDKLGVDPLGWLGRWVAVYADEGSFWDDLLQAEDAGEALEQVQDDLNRMPLAVAFAVQNPLKLALFMTSLRAFVDGSAPGMTDWKERVVEQGGRERRFVEIASPGLGQEFSLFYATTPTALVLSLHEPTLLAAMAREEARRSGGAAGAASWAGSQAGLELRGDGLQVLELLFGSDVTDALRRDSWRNLPILNEWKRLHGELDPLQLHERVFRERLACPGGGTYRWNEAWQTMESSVFGHPGEPKVGPRRPSGWEDLAAARFALGFELDGLRVRAALARKPRK